jgi:hypothetical protein
MIEIFLWWAGSAFLGTLILHAFILYGPTSEKIVDPEAHKSPFFESEAYGFKTIPPLLFCTPYGKKLVVSYWVLFLSFLPGFVVYMAYG